MKIGVMNQPTKKILDEIRWAGDNAFDFIDLTIEPPEDITNQITEIKQLLKHYNLSIIGHTNPTLPAIYPVSTVREACLVELRKAADLFSLLGANKMNIHPFYYGVHQTDEHKIDANIILLKELSDYCKNLGIELMLENYLRPFDLPDVLAPIFREVPDLKLHLDIGHANIRHNSIDLINEFFIRFSPRIAHLHIHDNKGKTDEHLPIGCGNIHWPAIVRIIQNANYNGTATLEVFSEDREYILISRSKLTNLLKSDDDIIPPID